MNIRKHLIILVLLIFILAIFSCQGTSETTKEQEKPEIHKIHWSYEGEGSPEHWGDLSEEYIACKDGKRQSPIDISKTTKGKKGTIKFSYKTFPLTILNNGHSIQVNSEKGNTITIGNQIYELLQLHFHSPSEHTIKGKFFDMELHLVHKNADGGLAVIGVLIKKGKKNNPSIQSLWDNFPKEVNKEETFKTVVVDPKKFLPKDIKHFYQYNGSLTTPPCSEIVLWNVLKMPIEVSEEQVSKFVSLIGENNRPVLPLNGRTVTEY